MWTALAVIAGLAVAGVLGYAAVKPATFQASRSTLIKAPPERVFPLVNDLRAVNTWNPFVKADPDVRLVYSGPDSGPGARHSFAGNGKVGVGEIEIVEAVAPARVVMNLHTIKPMEGHNRVEFTLEPAAEGTRITWSLRGEQPYIGRLVGVFINMDAMVGGAFETGLRDLKAQVER